MQTLAAFQVGIGKRLVAMVTVMLLVSMLAVLSSQHDCDQS